MSEQIDTNGIIKGIVVQVGAYVGCTLAKDAASRFSNPRKAFRNVEMGIEAIQQTAAAANAGAQMLNPFTGLPSQVGQPVQVEQAKPKYDAQSVTKKEFYNFRQEMMAEIKKLAPPPVTP